MDLSHIDDSIVGCRETRRSLDNAVDKVMGLDPDTSDADDFAHIQGLFSGFAEGTRELIDTSIQNLERLRVIEQQLADLSRQNRHITETLQRYARGEF